ncbi:transcriptional regulator, TetR family [Pseudonocardia thermophila]|jgi:Transcriptional regulator|uniref:Transcriptional regulator, TetR family n=1 Tax=Pseudonocardia thermophila TaxID=1848 RepID=A0A1M6VBA7_PSETH|nr:TetR/AcrR family transcriptional regulator [Pseudonocardia thermophila]SHK78783.1 transcriptional regulator, TetR family [Pseudonocardia thermophila]
MTGRTALRTARAERAAATRARIVEAASELFAERGYLDTTMTALAEAAGVAVQTLYLSFGSKGAVLEAVWRGTGPDQPDGWREQVTTAPDGPTALARHVAATAEVLERRRRLAAVLAAAAADPEPAALLAAAREAAWAWHAAVVDELALRPGFTLELTLERATQIVGALLSQEAYGLLVGENGWTVADWTAWTTRHLTADLFPG